MYFWKKEIRSGRTEERKLYNEREREEKEIKKVFMNRKEKEKEVRVRKVVKENKLKGKKWRIRCKV